MNKLLFNTLLSDNKVAKNQKLTFGTVVTPIIHPPIPKNFDGRVVWKDFLSPIKNQGLCGACYSYSVVGMLADRYAIQTLGQVKPDLSPLEFAICMKEIESPEEFLKSRTNLEFEKPIIEKQALQACKGNTLYNAARSIYTQGAFEESCVSTKDIEQFISRNGRMPTCNELEGDLLPSLCTNKKNPPRYWMAEEYYLVDENNEITEKTVEEIKCEIMKWGPVAVGFKVYNDFLSEYKNGDRIYTHPKKDQKSLGGHAVRIVGWGEEIQDGENISYWIIANSWGESWGSNGYGKIKILIPELELEKNVVSIWPQILGSDFPYEITHDTLVPQVSDDDDIIKAQLDIDPVTMYNNKQLELIKQGKMIGSETPFLNILKIPLFKNFWAYKIGTVKFELRDGSKVYSLLESNEKGNFIILMFTLIIIIVIVIVYFKTK